MPSCNPNILRRFDVNVCQDIWFSAKNVDDIQLVDEYKVINVDKRINDDQSINDDLGKLLSKIHNDDSSLNDITVLFFNKNVFDTNALSDADYYLLSKSINELNYNEELVQKSFRKHIEEGYYFNYVDYGSADYLANHALIATDFVYNIINKYVNDNQELSDNDYINFNKRPSDIGTISESLLFNNNKRLVDIPSILDNLSIRYNKIIDGYYFDNQAYGPPDYMENNAAFVEEYLTYVCGKYLTDNSVIVDLPKLNSNKYILEQHSINDSGYIYNNNYINYLYFSNIYAGDYVSNL